MLYEYTKTQLPHLQYIHDEVAGSAMTNKSIEWCNWEEDEQKLKVNFTNTLSTEDEVILNGIVDACPNETFDALEEMTVRNGNKYIGFKSPEVLTENTIYTLPEDGVTGQAVVTDGNKNLSFEALPIYVDRGDPSSWDFTVANFTTDGNWHDLDLSSIVPGGTKLVHMRIRLCTPSLAGINFRKKGNTNAVNIATMKTQVASVYYYEDFFVPCDANRIIQYLANDVSWTAIDVTVRGWFI